MNEILDNLDYTVIGGYFLIIFAITYWSYKKRDGENSSDYFLGGKSLGWFVIGASLFASNIGSEHLIGLAGQGASGDFVAGQFELLASLILILLAWFFVPFYMKSGVHTMPEFLERRYDKWARGYLSWVSIAAYILTKVSFIIFAGSIALEAFIGIDFWASAVALLIFTGLYTVIGGLRAVVYTDLMQTIVLIVGCIAVTWFGLDAVGGWGEMVSRVSTNHLDLWRPLSDPDFPWLGILLGAPILGIWYWCTDQVIVQRVLAAKGIDDARKGSIMAGYLKLLPLFIFIVPGVVAFALTQSPEPMFTFKEGGYDAALPLLTMHVLPHGLKGIMVASVMAALMSSLSSVFNSCSTLFTLDIYKKRYPSAGEGQLVFVGRVFTLVLIGLGMAWIPLFKHIDGGLFQKLQSIQAYISPPIAAVFLFGIMSRRLNAKGAKYALLVGAAIGAMRLALEVGVNPESLPSLLQVFVGMNFLYFALVLFIICSLVLIAVSRASEKPDLDKISAITVGGSTVQIEGEAGSLSLKIASALLVVCVIILWIVFR